MIGYDIISPTIAMIGYDILSPTIAMTGYDILSPTITMIGYDIISPTIAMIGYVIGFRTLWQSLEEGFQKSCLDFPTATASFQASLSDTFLQTLPDLVKPLKGHSLSPRSCPRTQTPSTGLRHPTFNHCRI